MRGLPDRLFNDLCFSTPHVVSVDRSEACKYSAWLGGSILASLLPNDQLFISQEEYCEWGSNVLRRKCIRPIYSS